jgi:uncharacterized protein (DUF488 family)
MTDAIYTVGHSTHSIQRFIELLEGQSIMAVCDVRSRPYSRVNPQFSRESLKQALQASNIKYVFLGEELGARSEDRSCYQNGQVQFDILSQTALFNQGIERVKTGAHSYRVALMCAEKEPLECHRTILVARRLADEGINVRHILGDGHVEEHERTIERLLLKLRMPKEDMFRSHDAVIEEAFKLQGNEIAYREKTPEFTTLEGLTHPRPVSGARL